MSYQDVILATSPVLYVPMQGTAITEDVQGTACTVDATTNQSGPVAWMTAADFSGIDESISVANIASYHPGNTFSVGGWFNRTGNGEGSGDVVIHLGSGDFTIWFPPTTRANKLVLRKAGTGDIWASSNAFATPYTDGWQHFVFTKAGTVTALYMNGTADGTAVGDQTVVASSSDVYFGSDTTGAGLEFEGLLCHIAIWDVALTSTDASDLYDATFVEDTATTSGRSQAIVIL